MVRYAYFTAIKYHWKPGRLAHGILQSAWQSKYICAQPENKQVNKQMVEAAAGSTVRKPDGAPELADTKTQKPPLV